MALFPSVRQRLATLGIALLAAPVFAPAVLAQAPTPVTIKSVRLSSSPAGPLVTIEADGTLPEPVVGEVDGPPRVFLDFPGVATSARPVTQSVDGVRRVRVALHNASPPSTRVVLDLDRPQPVRVNASARGAGRLTVLVGATTPPPGAPPAAPAPTPEVLPTAPNTPPAPRPPVQPGGSPASPTTDAPLKPVPPLGPATPPETPTVPPPRPPSTSTPPPPTTPAAAPTSTTAAPPRSPAVAKIPQREADRYREQVGQSLEGLRSMREMLVAIDQQRALGSVTAKRTEVSAILRALNTVKPNEIVRTTHDLLVRSASLALMALTLRDAPPGEPPNQEALRNASSAAAGALLLLDRVCMEIGCTAA
jgi:hypothetical protein